MFERKGGRGEGKMENRWDRKRPERKMGAELQKSAACPPPPSALQ